MFPLLFKEGCHATTRDGVVILYSRPPTHSLHQRRHRENSPQQNGAQ
jgi:hypothetical protein